MQGPVKEEALNIVNVPKDAFVQLVLFLKGVAHALDPELKAPVETIVRNFQPALQNMAPKTGGPGAGAGNGAPKAPGTPNSNPGAVQPTSAVGGPPVGPVRPTPRPPSFPDPLGGLANQLGDRLNLGTGAVPAVSSASSAFSALPNSNFRNMAPSPGSPSRMFGVAPGAPVGSAQTPDGGSSPSLLNLANNPMTSSAGGNLTGTGVAKQSSLVVTK